MVKSAIKKIGDFLGKLSGSRRPIEKEGSGEHPLSSRRKRKGPVRQRPPRKRVRSEKAPTSRGKRRREPATRDKAKRQAIPWDPKEFDVPPQEGKVRFHDIDLQDALMRAVHDLGFKYCTPIQAGILAHTLSGGDATGQAQTGTGKTAAFLITIITRLMRKPGAKPRKKGAPRALILAPTRELVLQIEKDARGLSKHSKHSVMAVFGGMEYGRQQKRLKGEAIDIVAATPGRLLDFKRKGYIDLSRVEILVIDEADRLLDMGFIPDVRRIIESTPTKGSRQTLFFSATLTSEVSRLAKAWTRNPVHVDVTPSKDVILSAIDQVVYTITDEGKFMLLCNLIIKRHWERVMVFANRKDETEFLKRRLVSRGIRCGLLTGDVSQEQRVKTLDAFRKGRFEVLVATDVAARGLHIDDVSHVVNYSLPMDPQDYVHRIGRTGRAGASGTSVSFATETEAYAIPDIEAFIGRSLGAIHPKEDLLTPLPPLPKGVTEPRKKPARSKGRRSHGGSKRSRRGTGRGNRRRETKS